MVGSSADRPFLRGRQPDLQQAGAQRRLAGDERGAAGGAGLLAVVVGEDRALVGDAVDVGRAVAHHAAVVGADVPVADVVAHDDEDVRLLHRLREMLVRSWRWQAWRTHPRHALLMLHMVDFRYGLRSGCIGGGRPKRGARRVRVGG